MGVDTTNVASGRGRNSVRITSKKSYDAGSLIILDLSHMPGSVCGTWPAFWTVGPSWPSNGEIDIIEGVNTQAYNHYAVHTGLGCSISDTGLFSGSIETQSCDVNAAGQPNNAGCSIVTSDTSSYGNGFNAGQGGVYATEFTSSAISIWFFPRSAIPTDIASGSPNPKGWGKPHASFGSPCNIGHFVKQQQIVFDTTFCGDWAGGVWSTDAMCSAKAATCQEFVQNNPLAFKETYWSINSLKVYTGSESEGGQQGGNGGARQRPTISPSVPTGQPGQPAFSSGAGGDFAQSSFAAGAPAPAPSAPQGNLPQGPPQAQQSQPQQQPGGNNVWGNGKVMSAWDSAQWQQPTGPPNNVAAAPSAGVQFYEASTGVGAAPAAATASSSATANANTNTNANTDGTPNNAADMPANAGADSTTYDVTDTDVAGAHDVGAPSPTPPAPQAPQAQHTASPSMPGPPSRPWGGAPWKRPSWMGKHTTVTGMSNDDLHKRDDEEQEKRDIDMLEVEQRRSERERRHLHEHLHRHVGVRKRGWWKS